VAAGIAWAIAANLLWALVFLAPLVLPGFSPGELAAGRNIAYGLISGAAFLVQNRGFRRPASHWAMAAALTLAGNIGYYLLLVWAIRLSGPAMPTLIIGLLPVTLALAGNVLERAIPLRRLVPGSVLIVGGLLLVNGMENDGSGAGYGIGLLAAAAAHLLWFGYGLGNAWFLKRDPGIDTNGWSSAVGVATLPFALVLWLIADSGDQAGPRDWTAFIAVSAGFGLLSSWLATALWNRASARLPTALAAQLIIFETVGALTYAWMWSGALPPAATMAGAALLVGGVVLSVRAFAPPRLAAGG
jgi:drug/metabolite transporter (DMT)-like permease